MENTSALSIFHTDLHRERYVERERMQGEGHKWGRQTLHSFCGFFIYYSYADRATQHNTHTNTNTNTQTICDVALNMKCCGFCGMFYIFLEIVFRFHMSLASLDNNNVWGVAALFWGESKRVESSVECARCSMTDKTHTNCKKVASPV